MTAPPRKLLSLWAPWYTFVAKGWKPLENREWEHAPSFRGPVWIHAALKSDPAIDDILDMVFEDRALWGVPESVERPTRESFAATAGHIVARARIVDITRNTAEVCAREPWAAEGQLGLRLANVEELATPIPWKGGQGLVDVDPLMVELVQRIAAHGHVLDLDAVPESTARWLVNVYGVATGWFDLLTRAVDQKQLRRDGSCYFTRAYKRGAPPPSPPKLPPAPAPAAPPVTSTDPRQVSWGW